jgi:hypothetical protein
LDLAEKIAKRKPQCAVYVVAANTVSPVLLEVDQAIHHSVSEKDEKEILTLKSMWSSLKKETPCLLTDD